MKTRLLLALLLIQFIAQAQTRTVSRLISVGRDAYTNGAMGPMDSTQYFTSGNNICDLELGYQNDSSHLFTYYPTKGGYILTTRMLDVLCPQGYVSTLQQNRYSNSDSLENAYMHTYAYLAGGVVMDTFLRWNSKDQKWDYSQLCADTFLDPKHLGVHFFYVWDSSGWQIDSRTQHSYTSTGNPDSVLDTYWDPVANRWTPSFLMKYDYDTVNRLIRQTYQSWDATTNAWLPITLITTDYNNVGDSAVQQWYSWDKSGKSWTKSTRHLFAYNAQGKVLCDIQQFWQAGTIQNFLNWSRTSYTYNDFGQATSMASERWNILDSAFEFSFQSMLTRYHYEEYTPTFVVANKGVRPAISLYPNPSHDHVMLDWKGTKTVPLSIQVIDMQGKPVMQIQKTCSDLHESLPTQQLPAGTYILQFDADGQTTQCLMQVVH